MKIEEESEVRQAWHRGEIGQDAPQLGQAPLQESQQPPLAFMLGSGTVLVGERRAAHLPGLCWVSGSHHHPVVMPIVATVGRTEALAGSWRWAEEAHRSRPVDPHPHLNHHLSLPGHG